MKECIQEVIKLVSRIVHISAEQNELIFLGVAEGKIVEMMESQETKAQREERKIGGT